MTAFLGQTKKILRATERKGNHEINKSTLRNPRVGMLVIDGGNMSISCEVLEGGS